MKKITIWFFTILMLATLFLPNWASASSDMSENVFVPQKRVVEYNYFKAGDTIDIGGTLQKDAYVVGNMVNVDGVIEGDLIGAASILIINGEVKGNVRFAAQSITINGTIGKNVDLISNSINIGPQAQIGWEILAVANLIDVKGNIGANANLIGSKVMVNNEINGWLFANTQGGILELGDQAKINGSLEHITDSELIKSDQAMIAGQIITKAPKDIASGQKHFADRAWSFVFSLMGCLLVAAVLIWLMPKQTKNTAEHSIKNFSKDLGVGVLFLIATPIAAIILAVTVIGLPLALIVAVLYFLMLYVAKIFFAIGLAVFLADLLKIDKKKQNIWLLALAGIVILMILANIPYIGWLVSLIAICVGIGAWFFVKKQECK